MNELQKEHIEKLTACGFVLVNDGDAYEPYQDFYRCTDLNKETNLREGVTFNTDDGTFYAMLDIQSDWGDNKRAYGSSGEFERNSVKTLPQALDWLEAAKKNFRTEIEAVTKIVHQSAAPTNQKGENQNAVFS